jgi:outer membrane protein OmpU|tara:strand:- start:567 stop:1553 length:987 start_codon:yes stop_codon:yes gene_type:complete
MNIKKVGLTALAGSLVATSAYAGALSVSGGAKISYVSKEGTIATTDVASGFAMDQEISVGGSGELDNGFTISVSHGLSGSGAEGSDTSSLTLDMGDMGKLNYNDTDGHYGLAGLEDFMPMAYEQANDGLGTTGTIAAMAKMASGQGFGYSTSVAGASISIGVSDGLGASTNRTDGGQDTTAASTNSSSSVAVSFDPMDGLTVKAGAGSEGQADGKELDHTTMGFTYAYGPATIGYQINDEDDSAASGTDYETEIYGISFMVNDNLSISYGEHNTDKANNSVDQEAESLQASYSMGGMTINLKDSEMSGVNNVEANSHETTEVLITFAF